MPTADPKARYRLPHTTETGRMSTASRTSSDFFWRRSSSSSGSAPTRARNPGTSIGASSRSTLEATSDPAAMCAGRTIPAGSGGRFGFPPPFGPLFSEIEQVDLARRSALGREQRRRLGSVLRPMVHDVHEHLPDGHSFVDVHDE